MGRQEDLALDAQDSSTSLSGSVGEESAPSLTLVYKRIDVVTTTSKRAHKYQSTCCFANTLLRSP